MKVRGKGVEYRVHQGSSRQARGSGRSISLAQPGRSSSASWEAEGGGIGAVVLRVTVAVACQALIEISFFSQWGGA